MLNNSWSDSNTGFFCKLPELTLSIIRESIIGQMLLLLAKMNPEELKSTKTITKH